MELCGIYYGVGDVSDIRDTHLLRFRLCVL